MLTKELEVAVRAAREAAVIIRGHAARGVTVERKADHSPVTAADREAEQKIVDVLTDAFPTYGVLGEELGERQGDGTRWIIDPIDGTKSFVRGIPYFATLIGLERDGEVVLGVVHEPVSGDLLHATKGGGAFAGTERLRVSERGELRRSMMVFGGLKAWRQTQRWDAFERLIMGSGRQRAYGDYFGHLFVVRGQAEAMIELDLKPWDMAPLKILVEEAGGRFSDIEGRETIYGAGALSTNGLVHEEALSLLRGGMGG